MLPIPTPISGLSAPWTTLRYAAWFCLRDFWPLTLSWACWRTLRTGCTWVTKEPLSCALNLHNFCKFHIVIHRFGRKLFAKVYSWSFPSWPLKSFWCRLWRRVETDRCVRGHNAMLSFNSYVALSLLYSCVLNEQVLHEALREHSMEAGRRVKAEGAQNDLLERIAGDPIFAAVHDSLDQLMDPSLFVGEILIFKWVQRCPLILYSVFRTSSRAGHWIFRRSNWPHIAQVLCRAVFHKSGRVECIVEAFCRFHKFSWLLSAALRILKDVFMYMWKWQMTTYISDVRNIDTIIHFFYALHCLFCPSAHSS